MAEIMQFFWGNQYAKNNDVSSTKLFEDGYILENRGNNLLILGGTEKGFYMVFYHY